jgi:integrase
MLAGVEPLGFHDIRHTVAKYLNEVQKVGINKVQQVLRHRRPTTTEIYLDGNYTDTREAMGLREVDSPKTVLEIPEKTTYC